MIDYIIKREITEFDDNLDLGRVQVRLFGIIRYLYKTYLSLEPQFKVETMSCFTL